MNKSLRSVLTLIGPYIGLIFVYMVFFFKAPDSFHSLYNTKTFLTQAVIIGIGSLGMTMIIISGGIDLSVGSLIALGTVISALILKRWGGATSGMAYYTVPAAAAMAAVCTCGAAGFLNGSAITGLRIVPFIVTLGMMQIARGVAKWAASSTTINVPENWLSNLMVVEPKLNVWWSVAPGLWLMLGLVIAVALMLRYTVFGRYIFAIGSNESTARLCGVNVGLTRVGIYAVSGLLIGIASVMQFSNLTLGDPTAAAGMELDIIAAVVIGGGSLSGGEGSAVGSLVGAVVMAILRNGCNLVGIENYAQNIIVGAIIIAAVGLDRFKHAKAT